MDNNTYNFTQRLDSMQGAQTSGKRSDKIFEIKTDDEENI
jgi:hypothetical protein